MSGNKIVQIPEDCSSVCPYLIIPDAAAEIKFLQNVFGGEVIEELKDGDGRIAHAEVRLGNVVIMMGTSTEQWKPITGSQYVFVDNADSVYKSALENGAKSVAEPSDKIYGIRDCGVKDSQGVIWWIAQRLEQLSQEELQKRMSNYKPS